MAQVQLRKKQRFFRREDISLWLMALPTILFLLIFCYAPMFGLIMAFQNLNVAKGILASPTEINFAQGGKGAYWDPAKNQT